MRRRTKTKKVFRFRKSMLVLLVFVAVMALLLYIVENNMRPIVQTISGNQARILCTRAVNNAVVEELGRLSLEYDGLVTFITDAAGNISAIETNAIEMNRIKAALTEAVNEALTALPTQDVGIPLGTLTGIDFLSGRGPRIRLRMQPSSYVESQMINQFDSTGINQTRHQIMIEFTVTMSAILAPYTTRVEVKTNMVVAETIIIGTVPEMYANF